MAHIKKNSLVFLVLLLLFATANESVFASDLNNVRLKIFHLFNFIGSSDPSSGSSGGSGGGTGGSAPTPTPVAGATSTPAASTPTPRPQSTPTPGSGTQSTPTPGSSAPSSADIKAVVDAVTESNVLQYLENLTDDDRTPEKDQTQSRFSVTSGNDTEALYIKSHFESLGLEAELQPFTINRRISRGPLAGQTQSGTTNNIIGRLYGQNRNTFYLVTAHMDSTAEQSSSFTDMERGAPGADDNGSGTAAVMEIARAIKTANVPLTYSIEFVLFSGEEQHLLGSDHYVNNLPAGKRIGAVVNLDMIGDNRKNPGRPCVNFGFREGSGGNIISDAIVSVASSQSIGLVSRSAVSNTGRSDHASFWSKNITAIYGMECDFTESGSQSVYHTSNDKVPSISTDQITKTAKAVGGALVQFAQTGVGLNIFNSTLPHTQAVLGDHTAQTGGLRAQAGTNDFEESVAEVGFPNNLTLASVEYKSLAELDTLFDHAHSVLVYIGDEEEPVSIMLGLFTQDKLTEVESAGFTARVIEQNPDLSKYEYFYHPAKGQAQRLNVLGTAYAFGEHYAIVKIDEEKIALNPTDTTEFEFFDLHWEPGIDRPAYDTVRITAEPKIAPTDRSLPESAISDSIPGGLLVMIVVAAIIAILAIGAIAFGIFKYFKKKKSSQPQTPAGETQF